MSEPTAPAAPWFSVIVPAYNHAQFLPEAVASVLDQSFFDFEVVVIDDGSTDETPRIVPRHDVRVRYFRQENQGLSAARNSGIRESRGRIMTLLDADDRYEPSFLEVMRGLFDDSETDAAYCGFQSIDEQGRSLPFGGSTVVPPNQLRMHLLNGNFVVPSCMAVRKSCYEVVGPFDTELRSCEDWDMWLRLSRQFLIRGTPERLVRYRVVTRSMSSDPSRMLNFRMAVLDKHLSEKETPASLAREARGNALLRATVEYLQNEDLTNAVGTYVRMVQAYPRLATSERTYFEIACGTQPRGFAGDSGSFDPSAAAYVLSAMLEKLETASPPVTAAMRRKAFAKTRLALGKLCYASKNPGLSRRFLLEAAAADPGLTLAPHMWSRFLRSMIPSRTTHSESEKSSIDENRSDSRPSQP